MVQNDWILLVSLIAMAVISAVSSIVLNIYTKIVEMNYLRKHFFLFWPTDYELFLFIFLIIMYYVQAVFIYLLVLFLC